MSKLNISDLCSVLVAKNGLQDAEAQSFVKMMFDIIQEGLEEDKIVKVKGLGTFKIIEVDDRESINVNTGERVLIAGHSKVTFTPDSVMKEIVNKPFSQFETVILNDGVDFPETATEEPSAEVEEENEPFAVEEEMPAAPVMEETATPAMEEMAPVVEETVPTVETAAPEMEEAAPVVEEAAPVVEEEMPAVETAAPEMEEVAPEMEAASPEIDEAVAPVEAVSAASVSSPAPSPQEEEEEEEDQKISPLRWIIGAIVILLLAAAGIAGGYMYAKYEMEREQAAQQMEKDMKVAESVAKKAEAEIKKDTVANEVDATKIGTISVENVKEEPTAPDAAQKKEETKKEEVKKEEVKKEQPQTDSPDKYAAKDARVRTGAYKIVGLDRTVKARAGQKLEDLADRFLGPGMSCYVEVYNDLKGSTVLKDGQAIKIPKLELKKKKRVAQ